MHEGDEIRTRVRLEARRYLIGTDTSVKASMLAPSWSKRGVAKPVTVAYVEPSPVETDTRSADGPPRWPSSPIASCSGSTRLACSALGSGSVTAMARPPTAVEGIHTYQFKWAWLESLKRYILVLASASAEMVNERLALLSITERASGRFM